MNEKLLALLLLTLFGLIVIDLKAQELRVEYPEIRLTDKRILTHARVESFNGLAFCIVHDAGIEAFVRWEIMPAPWKSAFPQDPQLALKLADKARTNEAKSPLPPIDLKKRTGDYRKPQQSEIADKRQAIPPVKPTKKTWKRDELTALLQPGMKKDEVIRTIGKPDQTEQGPKGRDEWYYSEISMDPVSSNVDRGLRIYFGIGYDDRPVIASSSARLGGGGGVYAGSGKGYQEKDELERIVFAP